MKHKGLPLNGWLCLDKPVGLTSTQALARARRFLGAAKVGHGGTLDPLASGILPLAFGEATKTVAYVMDAQKTYRFTLGWGEQRSTDDAEGDIVATSDIRPDRAAVEAILPRFTGLIQQTPPAFSALKVDGQRAYDRARNGEAVDLAPRTVRVDRIVCLGDNAETFEVTCGKGTYIRSLARDIAVALGTVGHVAALRRLRVGLFDETNARTLADLEAAQRDGTPPESLLLPVKTALAALPVLALSADEADSLGLGQPLFFNDAAHQDRLLALPDNVRSGGSPLVAMRGGTVLALAALQGSVLRTLRKLNSDV